VGLVFDVGHEALCRRPVGLPIHDSKLILDVHVNNNDGVNDRHWAPEKGVIQAAEYIDTIKQLQSIGYDRNFTIELLNIHGSLDLPSSKSLIDFLGF